MLDKYTIPFTHYFTQIKNKKPVQELYYIKCFRLINIYMYWVLFCVMEQLKYNQTRQKILEVQ